MEEYKKKCIQVNDMNIRANNAKSKVQEKVDYDQGYQDRLLTQKKDNELLHKNQLGYKAGLHDKQKQFIEEQKVTNTKRNPFNAKINQQSLTNARQHRQTKEEVGLDTVGMGLLEEEGGDDLEDRLEI